VDLQAILNIVLARPYFHPNPEGVSPIQCHHTPKPSRLLVAIGPNASGKSFFRRVLTRVAHDNGVEPIPLSLEGRSTSGFQRLMVYGTEGDQSTGRNSCTTIETAIRTSQGRTTSQQHMVFFDEPDIGLSEEWSASVGVALRGWLQAPPDPLVFACVVTHSQALLEQLEPLDPGILSFGPTPYRTLQDWYGRPKQIRPLVELSEEAHTRKRLIEAARKAYQASCS
jgi:hypothetical protein